MTLSSKSYDVADFAAAQELYHSNGWSDGLPVVPPTSEAVPWAASSRAARPGG